MRIDTRVFDALASREFIVNAAKYGAIGNGGLISIKAKIDAGFFRLNRIEESASKVVATNGEVGQGVKIILQMLPANTVDPDTQCHEYWLHVGVRFRHGCG